MGDNRKVFLVTMSFDYIAVAENEDEAKEFARESLNNLCGIEDYCEVGPLTHIPNDWESDSLVYHNGPTLITVEQACKMSPEYQKSLERFAEIKQKYCEKVPEK